MYYSPTIVASGQANLEALRDDIKAVVTYCDANLADVGARDGGLFFSAIIGKHAEVVGKFSELVTASRALLGSGASNIQKTIDAYRANEQDNQDLVVSQLWSGLETTVSQPPIVRSPTGTAKVGELPSSVLGEPTTNVGHWIFDILSWPDFLSIASWARKILGWIWEFITGKDPWQWLWEHLGGDWEKIGLVSSAWKNLGGYFTALPKELTARMQVMFEGWYDSAAATAAGEYLAKAAYSLDGVTTPLEGLAKQYNDVAWASYSLCQAVYSGVDAAIDALIAASLGGLTFLEALGALFTAGALAPAAVVTAVVTAVETVNTAWGTMMTAVYLVVGLGATLGAYTTKIEWVTVPKG